MGKINKKRLRIYLTGAVVVFGLIAQYQNCGGGEGLKVEPSGPLSIEYSNSANFSVATTNFNFGDTVYQRLKYFGPDITACAEVVGQSDGYCATHMVPLSSAPGWAYNSASNEWTSQIAASTFHGRTIKGFFKRAGEVAISKTLSVQSVADATTSDVLVFYSLDAAGRNVIMNVKNSVGITFYSHVKNGTTADYSCIYVVTNTDGTPGTDNCKNTTPPGANWVLLAADNVTDNNTTMLTQSGLSSNFHTTQIQQYISKGGVKTVPFYFDFIP